MATTTATSQAPVEPKKWIQPFDLNYNVTKNLWNKETSDNCVIAVAQKVIYLATAVFTAVLETLQNVFLAAANGGIWVANGVHSYFDDKQVEQVKTQPEKPVATTTTTTTTTTVQEPVEVRPAPKTLPPKKTLAEKAASWGNWALTPVYYGASIGNKYVIQPIMHPQVTYDNLKSWYNTPNTPAKAAPEATAPAATAPAATVKAPAFSPTAPAATAPAATVKAPAFSPTAPAATMNATSSRAATAPAATVKAPAPATKVGA